MSARPSARWVWGLAFLLVLGPLLVWWLVTPSLAVYPVTWLMPDRASAAVRLANLEPAWRTHWQHRPQTAPEDALRELMIALDEWPRWLKKYGERGANTRLWLYQRALFNAVGEEAWLVFGEWGPGQPGTGQMGLVALIRSRTSVAARVGDLMNLAMSEYQLTTHRHGRVTIYEYQDKKISRSVTFCQIGGWICASLQQRGLGPLPAIIDRVEDKHSQKPGFMTDWWRSSSPGKTIPALSAAAWPDKFWGQLRLFRQQRGKSFSDESENRIEYWRQRLDGIGRIELVQDGDSLFDLKMGLIGERPAELTRSLNFKPKTQPEPVTAGGDPRPQLAQLDISLGLARLVGPLAGLSAESMMKGIDSARPYLGQLGGELRDRIEDLPPDVEGRMGLALYPGSILPEATVWLDDAPERAPAISPGQYWPMLTAPEPDRIFRLPALAQPAIAPVAATIDPIDRKWLDFERDAWTSPPPRPVLFATVHFERVAAEIRQVPEFFLNKKAQKRLKRAERIVKAISLAATGAALRIDATPDRWLINLRTP